MMKEFSHTAPVPWLCIGTLACLFMPALGVPRTGGAVPSTAPAFAHIVILESTTGGPYHAFAQSFQQTLATLSPQMSTTVTVTTITSIKNDTLATFDTHDLLIPVGTQATAQVLQWNHKAAVLSVLVPEITFAQLAKQADNETISRPLAAIYLDQPLIRYVLLAKLVVPGMSTLGVILGPVTRSQGDALAQVTRANGLKLATVSMRADSSNPLPALSALLEDSSVLLALPDPVVYNRYTLPPLLLTTFRYRVPVIGFSEAFVTAGAVAAVYSRPAQIGRQAAEMLFQPLPATGVYPRYFDVHFNAAVAQALSLALPSEAAAVVALQKAGSGP